MLSLDDSGGVWFHPRAAAAHEATFQAGSFAEWLREIAAAFEAGTFVITEDARRCFVTVVHRDFAEEAGLLVRGEPDAVRKEKLGRRPPPIRVAGYVFAQLDRWHLIAPPTDAREGRFLIASEFSRGDAEQDPATRIRAVLRERGHEIAVADGELRCAWASFDAGLLPKDLPRPPRVRESALGCAHVLWDAVDGRTGPGTPALVREFAEALEGHAGACRAWTLPATAPLPDEVVDDLATVIREHLALEWSPPELREPIRRCLGAPPDPSLSGRLPLGPERLPDKGGSAVVVESLRRRLVAEVPPAVGNARRLARYVFSHLYRWHLITPPIGSFVGGETIVCEFSRDSAAPPRAAVCVVVRARGLGRNRRPPRH